MVVFLQTERCCKEGLKHRVQWDRKGLNDWGGDSTQKVGDAGIAAVKGQLDTMVKKGEILEFIEVSNNFFGKSSGFARFSHPRIFRGGWWYWH